MLEQPDSEITEETIKQFLESENAVSTRAGIGTWASLIRIFDPLTFETQYIHEFDQDEAAFRYIYINFDIKIKV